MSKKLSSTMNRLKAKATENTTVSMGSNKEGFTTIKPGISLDHDVKHKPAKRPDVCSSASHQHIGMSKGITKNMDNYESLRVDCWLSDDVKDGESIENAYTRIEAIIDEALVTAVSNTASS